MGRTVSGYLNLIIGGDSKDFIELINTDYIKFMYQIKESVCYVNSLRL